MNKKTNKPTKPRTIRGIGLLRNSSNASFRNFEGRPDRFNPDGGKRYFHIQLDEELAAEMRDEGWNVKSLEPREGYEDREPLYFLKVNLRYRREGEQGKDPRIIQVTAAGKQPLDKSVVGLLDAADVEKVDVILNPYNRDDSGTTTAYLQTAFVYIQLDELELEYALEELDNTPDEIPGMVCDDDGVCYVNGVRVN